jgi:hypothetical protein
VGVVPPVGRGPLMASIAFRSQDDPWVVARWAFDGLLCHARDALSAHPRLLHELDAAQARERLNLAGLSEEDGRLIAMALAGAADTVRRLEQGSDDPLTISWLDALADLKRRLGQAHP